MTIGNRISELRKSKGFTQEYVAEQLGVSRQAVSKWEQDLTSPDTKNLIALSALLGASIEFIATGNPGPAHNSPNDNAIFIKTTRARIDRKVSAGHKQLLFGIILSILTIFLGLFSLIPGIVLIVIGCDNLSSASHLEEDLKTARERQQSNS